MEEFIVIFEKLKPVLEDFIARKNALQHQITNEGTMPDDVRTQCLWRTVTNVQRFDSASNAASEFANWYSENLIVRIESNGQKVLLLSKKDVIEGRRGEKVISEDSPSLDSVYKYTIDLAKLKNLDFYHLLATYPFFGISLCSHLQDHADFEKVEAAVIQRRPFLRRPGATKLELLCKDCSKRIENVCSVSRVHKDGPIYKSSHDHDHILMELCLKQSDIVFEETGVRTLFEATGMEFFLPRYRTIVTNKKPKDIEATVQKVRPLIIVAPGQKGDIVKYLKFNCHAILFDSSPDSLQKFTVFDKDKVIEREEEKCCEYVCQKIDGYIEEQGGKEHDRIIEALARIGKDLGFISQREVPIKGSKTDLVWLERNSAVFAAVEVETMSSLKKDIISTWELEPKLAIIVGHYATDKPLTDILTYVLLKNMPHMLFLINNTTKKGFLILRQELLKQYDIAVKANSASDVNEV